MEKEKLKTKSLIEDIEEKKLIRSTYAKIFFYLLRDYENSGTLKVKLNVSKESVRKGFNLIGVSLLKSKNRDDCERKKIEGRKSERNTSNRYNKHTRSGYQQNEAYVYRINVSHLFLKTYGEDKLSKLSNRNKLILEILLQPEFMRKNVFNESNLNKINNVDDINKCLYEFIDNFIYNFQNTILKDRNSFDNSLSFNKPKNKDRKIISEKILKDMKKTWENKYHNYSPENDTQEFLKYFYDFNFLADLILNLCSKAYIDLLYERLVRMVGYITENEKLVLNNNDVFSLKIKEFLEEIDKQYSNIYKPLELPGVNIIDKKR